MKEGNYSFIANENSTRKVFEQDKITEIIENTTSDFYDQHEKNSSIEDFYTTTEMPEDIFEDEVKSNYTNDKAPISEEQKYTTIFVDLDKEKAENSSIEDFKSSTDISKEVNINISLDRFNSKNNSEHYEKDIDSEDTLLNSKIFSRESLPQMEINTDEPQISDNIINTINIEDDNSKPVKTRVQNQKTMSGVEKYVLVSGASSSIQGYGVLKCSLFIYLCLKVTNY